MNRRSFLSQVITFGVAPLILPAATTYNRIWKSTIIRPDFECYIIYPSFDKHMGPFSSYNDALKFLSNQSFSDKIIIDPLVPFVHRYSIKEAYPIIYGFNPNQKVTGLIVY